MRLSALEQVPLFDGSTPHQALEDMVSLARGLEEMDFHRFWIAEHHNTPVFMSSAPELVMTHLLDRKVLHSGNLVPRTRRHGNGTCPRW